MLDQFVHAIEERPLRFLPAFQGTAGRARVTATAKYCADRGHIHRRQTPHGNTPPIFLLVENGRRLGALRAEQKIHDPLRFTATGAALCEIAPRDLGPDHLPSGVHVTERALPQTNGGGWLDGEEAFDDRRRLGTGLDQIGCNAHRLRGRALCA